MALCQDNGICITEGKKDQIATGIVQNIAQLTALGEKRGTKRGFKTGLPLYGVATTCIEWILSRRPRQERQEKPSLYRTDKIYATDEHQIKHAAECLAAFTETDSR